MEMERLEETWLSCYFVSFVEALGVNVLASFDKLVHLHSAHGQEMVRDGEELHGQELVEKLEEGVVYELKRVEQQMAVVSAQMEAA